MFNNTPAQNRRTDEGGTSYTSLGTFRSSRTDIVLSPLGLGRSLTSLGEVAYVLFCGVCIGLVITLW